MSELIKAYFGGFACGLFPAILFFMLVSGFRAVNDFGSAIVGD